jgi:hypothetical protein
MTTKRKVALIQLLEGLASSGLQMITVCQALSRCITDITGYQNALVNIVYFCSKRSSMDNDAVASCIEMIQLK